MGTEAPRHPCPATLGAEKVFSVLARRAIGDRVPPRARQGLSMGLASVPGAPSVDAVLHPDVVPLMDDTQLPGSTPNDNPLLARRRLGRGLNSLLGTPETGTPEPASSTEYTLVAAEAIARNPYQPRLEFDGAELAELVESIGQHGILSPLLVRHTPAGYQLIAGERRLLAARKVGLVEVPCRVVEMEDKAVCEVAIVENVQRADLNDLEKATAFQQYLDKFGGSVEELARKMGKDRSTISNCLRLLELPEAVKLAMQERKISAGHARALLPLESEEQQVEVCQQIVGGGWSVRQTEEQVREKLLASDTIPIGAGRTKGRSKGSIGGAHVRDLERQLREVLGLKVEISLKGKQAGKLTVHFGSNDEFDRVCSYLRKAS